MDRNTRYLAARWAVAIVSMIIVALMFSSSLREGRVWSVVLPLIVVMLLLIVIRSRTGERKIRSLLQSRTPDDLVQHYRRTIRTGVIRDGDAMLAHACALAYMLYGYYPAARSELGRIDWERRDPLIRAAGRSAEALLYYFFTRDYERGVEVAREARDLARIPGVFPGSRTSAAAFDTIVEIGEILCERYGDQTIASLERSMAKLPVTGKLLAAWGLAVAYHRNGDDAKRQTMQKFLHEAAPHCVALSLRDHSNP